ncbi:MAG: hypothetical protein KIT36_16220 [Alphaproteobacteria bacterium]|nr:hypothetical protein [Alphaproteobacteria bacterium]
MGTTKLAVYNGTLRLLGDDRLASLSENREPRRVLDDLWDEHVRACLEAGSWNFALRSIQVGSDPDVALGFGFQFAFEKPDDWLRTAALSADESFALPLTDYADEAEYWKANVEPIYVRYVSDDAAFGMDTTRWTPSFSLFVQSHLAAELAAHHRNAQFGDLDRLRQRRRGDALAKDALGQAPQFAPRGSWVRTRWGSAARNERTRQ